MTQQRKLLYACRAMEVFTSSAEVCISLSVSAGHAVAISFPRKYLLSWRLTIIAFLEFRHNTFHTCHFAAATTFFVVSFDVTYDAFILTFVISYKFSLVLV